MFRIFIVEDEPNARDLLTTLVERYLSNAIIVGLAENIQMAKESIAVTKPDLLLMDIELNNRLSFEIFDQIDPSEFQIIFITGHKNYAFDAFKIKAIDYLLKPINVEDFVFAVEKAQRYKMLKTGGVESNAIIEKEKLNVKTKDGISLIDYQSIQYFKSDGKYTWIILDDGKKIFSSINIGKFEEQIKLDGQSNSFFRIHKSYMIHLSKVSFINNKEKTITTKSNFQLPFSTNKKGVLMSLLNSSPIP